RCPHPRYLDVCLPFFRSSIPHRFLHSFPTRRSSDLRYLVFGTLVASGMQIYLPTRLLTQIGGNALTAILVMMLLAFILSLCSEADAFIGASLLSTFATAPILAFLFIGPMVDIKNLMMMLHSFKTSFIMQFLSISIAIIIVYCLVVRVIA